MKSISLPLVALRAVVGEELHGNGLEIGGDALLHSSAYIRG
jgi:hypothetical protein